MAFEGGGTGQADYFCILDRIEIKLNEEEIQVIKNVKFFLMDNLQSEMIIGQESIFKEKLYGIMERIDAIELGVDSEVEELETAMENMELGQQGSVAAMYNTEEDAELLKGIGGISSGIQRGICNRAYERKRSGITICV